MPFWRLFYHVIWTTKTREPALDAPRTALVERSIRTTCRECETHLHALGVMPDHVHVALSIPPKLAIATLVGRLKGASAHAVNDGDRGSADVSLVWQAQYGVLSFGEKNLPDVISYVQNQSARHAANRLWPALETVTDRPQPAYGV